MGAIIGLILFGIPSAIIASAKGFKPIRWLFACGIIGLITVASLSSAKAENLPSEDRALHEAKGDKVGAVMCGICVSFSVLITLVAISAA